MRATCSAGSCVCDCVDRRGVRQWKHTGVGGRDRHPAQRSHRMCVWGGGGVCSSSRCQIDSEYQRQPTHPPTLLIPTHPVPRPPFSHPHTHLRLCVVDVLQQHSHLAPHLSEPSTPPPPVQTAIQTAPLLLTHTHPPTPTFGLVWLMCSNSRFFDTAL